MGDELILCPSWNHELRLPRELLGQTVECPQCGSRFGAPAPWIRGSSVAQSVGYPQSDAQLIRAGNSLRAPAVILLVLSILNALLSGWSILSARAIVADPDAVEVQMHAEIDRQPNLSPDDRASLKKMFSAEAIRANSNVILSWVGIVFAAALITAF